MKRQSKSVAVVMAVLLCAFLVFPPLAGATHETAPVAYVGGTATDPIAYPGQPISLNLYFENVGGVGLLNGLFGWGTVYGWTTPVVDNKTTGTLGGQALNVAVGDANNDGDNEIVVGTDGDDVYMYDGSGNNWTQSSIDTNIGGDVLSVAIGNYDGDGSNEVVVGTATDKVVEYSWNSGTSTWDETTLGSFANDVKVVVIANADGDSDKEMLAVVGTVVKIYDYHKLYTVVGSADWYWNDLPDKGATVLSIAVGDYDGDGTPEIVFGNTNDDFHIYSGTYAPGIWPTQGSWTWTHENEKLGIGGDVNALAVGDADNDGDNDIVAGTGGAGDAYMYDSTLAQYTIEADISNGPVNSVAIGDADNDGNKEVVVGNGGTTWPNNDGDAVWIYQGSGNNWARDFAGAWDDDVLSVAIGDADDNDGGNNEIVRGDKDAVRVSEFGLIFWPGLGAIGPIGLAPGGTLPVPYNPVAPSVTADTTMTLRMTGSYEDPATNPYSYPDQSALVHAGYSPEPFAVDLAIPKELPPTGVNTYWLGALALLAMAAGFVVIKRAKFLRA